MIACAPAAPSGQPSGTDDKPEPTATKTPTPSPTPEMICDTVYDPEGNPRERCRPLVPPVINQNLQDDIDEHMAEKEKRKGTRQTIEPKMLHVTIITDGPEHVDDLVAYLKANTQGRVREGKGTRPYDNGANSLRQHRADHDHRRNGRRDQRLRNSHIRPSRLQPTRNGTRCGTHSRRNLAQRERNRNERTSNGTLPASRATT